MKLVKEISNVIHDTLVNSISSGLEKILWYSVEEVNGCYEIKLHPSWWEFDELDSSEFDAKLNEIIESIDYHLLPSLREKFIAELKEVNYLNNIPQIVLMCESVE